MQTNGSEKVEIERSAADTRVGRDIERARARSGWEEEGSDGDGAYEAKKTG